MIRLIFIFLLLFISVYIGIHLSPDPGYVLIELKRWRIEATFWTAVILLGLSFILLHLFLMLTYKVRLLPLRLQTWQKKRRAQKARHKTQKGLIEFSEGYWRQAKEDLIEALPDVEAPLLNYLTAARAAQEMGENQLRDNYLRQAQQSMPDAKIAVELTQAQLQLMNQQWEQALATLRHLRDLVPHHPYVLKLLMKLYQEVRDWPQLIILLPELKKQHILSKEQYEQFQLQVYLQAMSDFAKYNQKEAIEQLIHHLPKNLAFNGEIMAEYCGWLIKQKEYEKAESILRHCLKKEFNEKLILLYGLTAVTEQQLAFAESFLKKHPHSAELYQSLGRLSIHNKLWGKAKSYLEQSIVLKATPSAYADLGQLLEGLQEPTAAFDAYKQGLILSTVH